MSCMTIDFWVRQLGGDDITQFPERVNVRVEDCLEEGDEFSSGQSVPCFWPLQHGGRVEGW